MESARRRTRLFSFVALGGLAAAATYFQPYRPAVVVGRSMSPVYHAKEPLLVDTRVDEIHRNDVVLVRRPGGVYVKRVRLIEGDSYLEFSPAGFWQLPYNRKQVVTARRAGIPTRYRTIPAGEVYVTGDNQFESEDSRAWGPVRVEDIVGEVVDWRVPGNDQWEFPFRKYSKVVCIRPDGSDAAAALAGLPHRMGPAAMQP